MLLSALCYKEITLTAATHTDHTVSTTMYVEPNFECSGHSCSYLPFLVINQMKLIPKNKLPHCWALLRNPIYVSLECALFLIACLM